MSYVADRSGRHSAPDMWVSGCGSSPVLWGGLGTGDAVTRGSSFKSDDAVEVVGSVNRAGVTDSGPSVRIDSYHPDETSQVRQCDSAPRFAARPVGVPHRTPLAARAIAGREILAVIAWSPPSRGPLCSGRPRVMCGPAAMSQLVADIRRTSVEVFGRDRCLDGDDDVPPF